MDIEDLRKRLEDRGILRDTLYEEPLMELLKMLLGNKDPLPRNFYNEDLNFAVGFTAGAAAMDILHTTLERRVLQ